MAAKRGLWKWTAWAQALTLSFPGCVPLGKPLNLSVLQLPLYKMGMI